MDHLPVQPHGHWLALPSRARYEHLRSLPPTRRTCRVRDTSKSIQPSLHTYWTRNSRVPSLPSNCLRSHKDIALLALIGNTLCATPLAADLTTDA